MSRSRRAAKAAAVGSGSVGAAAVAAVGLVYGQTKLARRRIKPIDRPVPDGSGLWTWRPEMDGEPLRVAVLGDSLAAGYGVDTEAQTPAALAALGLSRMSHHPVEMRSVATVGAESADLVRQVELVLDADDDKNPQLSLIMIGANDVTHRVRPATAVRQLAAAVRVLREAGSEVVVGTCPDLGTIRPIAQPLRYLARRQSRNLAAAQTVAVIGAGGRTVSLGDVLGPRFARERELFGDDAFHPSAAGYLAAVETVLPSAAAALGLPTHTEAASALLSRRARPVAKAAAHAVTHPGTEVAGAQLHGRDSGRRGRFARLLRRTEATEPDRADRQPAGQEPKMTAGRTL
jgi:lysophospholipase L1-like esterase